MDVNGTDFFTVPSIDKNKSDILLVHQHNFCEDNIYEAYGFSENHFFLKRYTFLTPKKTKQFQGKILEGEKAGEFFAYFEYDPTRKMSLLISDKLEQIQLKHVENFKTLVKPIGLSKDT